MNLIWIAAMYNKIFGKQYQRKSDASGKEYDQFKILEERDKLGDAQTFLIGSSIIARWCVCQEVETSIWNVRLGIEGFDTFDLVANTKYLERLRSTDTLICYCGSNDFFGGRDTSTSIQNLRDVFGACQCKIIYLNVIKSPLMIKYFAKNEMIDEFNRNVETLYNAQLQSISTISIDDELKAKDYVWDGVHLKKSGYDKLKKIISTKIQSMTSTSPT